MLLALIYRLAAVNGITFGPGFGSDLGELVIIGSIITVYRHNNCAIKGCWRIGRHGVDGTPYKTWLKQTRDPYDS